MGYSLKAPVGVCKEFELLRHFNQQDKHGVKKSKNLKNVLFFFIPRTEVMPTKTSPEPVTPDTSHQHVFSSEPRGGTRRGV